MCSAPQKPGPLLCLPSPISLKLGFLCFLLLRKRVLCLWFCEERGAPSPGSHSPGHRQQPWVLGCCGAGGAGGAGGTQGGVCLSRSTPPPAAHGLSSKYRRGLFL